MTEVHVQINGSERVAEVASHETLADLLRDRLRLTGTRVGCEQGVCGACTVLVDGEPVRSCLVLAAQVDGRAVETVEGLGDHPVGRQVVDEFLSRRAYQCGFCTAGFEMLGVWLVRGGTGSAAREVVADNLCRCTGYTPIVEALEALEAAPCAGRCGCAGTGGPPTASFCASDIPQTLE